jgi:RNA polymerase sigma factor (sigma-70 family)
MISAVISDGQKRAQQDRLLVQRCLRGSEEAWSELIDKYKNLIFSIPVKYGLSYEDASEIFQNVCLNLLKELSDLREPQALAGWLIRLTVHKCIRMKHQKERYVCVEPWEDSMPAETSAVPEQLLQQIEREQMLRDAIRELSPECRRLVELLFYSSPPLRYDEAAAILGLAKGSIGATRMRCLERLRRSLEKKGFR